MLPTPRKKNYKDTAELIAEIPQLKPYSGMKFEVNGSTTIVRIRRKDLKAKPLMYLWDLDRSCYLSSLYPLTENTFKFEINRTYYTLEVVNGIPTAKEVA